MHNRLTVCMLTLVALASTTRAAAPGSSKNIFDDDWTPPQRASAPPPVPPHPAPETPAPATTRVEPPILSNGAARPAPRIATPAATSRRPVPAKADLTRSRSLLRDAYARQLSDRAPAARRDLSDVLLNEAKKALGDPAQPSAADAFALFVGAMNAAKEGNDLTLASTAATELAKAFEVPALPARAEAALSMSLQADTAEMRQKNLDAAIQLLQDLIRDDDIETARKLRALPIDRVAAGQPAALEKWRSHANAAAEIFAAYDKIKFEFTTLRTTPESPKANAAIGRYYCFAKNEWARGLPLLAKGDDPETKTLAARELAGFADSDARFQLGDEWWKLSAKRAGVEQRSIRQHAVEVWEPIATTATPLQRKLIEERTRIAGPAQPTKAVVAVNDKAGWTDLFNGKDLSGWRTDRGEWKVQDGVIVGTGELGYLHTEEPIPESFHLRVEAMVTQKCVGAIVFREQRGVGKYVARWSDKGNTQTGSLSYWGWAGKGDRVLQNAKTPAAPVGQWFVMEIIADGPHLTVLVNGKKTADVKEDAASAIATRLDLRVENATDQTSVMRVRKVQIRAIPPSK